MDTPLYFFFNFNPKQTVPFTKTKQSYVKEKDSQNKPSLQQKQQTQYPDQTLLSNKSPDKQPNH